MRTRFLEIALAIGLCSVGCLAGPSRPRAAANYLDEAQHLAAGGQLRAAEIELKNAVRADQSNMTAHYRLAVIQMQLGEAAAAEHEASVAKAGGFDPEKVVPLLAETYLMQGKYRELLQQFPATAGSTVQRADVLVARGFAQLALNQRSAAKASFEQAQHLAPNAPQPLLAEAKLALGEHQVDAAGQLFDRVLSLDPKSRDALTGKADVLRLKGDVKSALSLLAKVLAESPDFVQARLERAQILLSEKKYKAAEDDIRAAIRAQPSNGGAYYLDALIAIHNKDFNKAEADLNKISGMLASIAKGYYVAAIVQYNLHHLDQAADAAQRFVARNPDDLPGHKLLGLIELSRGHPAQTVAQLSKFDAAGKADAGTFDLLGRAYAELGLSSKALAAFNDAVQRAPNDAALRLRLGATQLRTGDTAAGIKDLREAMNISPSAPAGEMLVLTDLEAAHWPQATATAEKLQKAQPKSPIAGNLLGLVKLAQFDLPGAQAQFADLVKQYPKYLPARFNLAHVLDLEGKSDEAEGVLKDIVAREPTNGAALTRLVNQLLRDGKSDAAVGAAEQAHNAAPDNVGITAGLIDLYLRVGRKGDALTLAQRESGDNSVAKFPLIAARVKAEFAAGQKSAALQTFHRLLTIAPARTDLLIRYAAALLAEGDKAGASHMLDQAIKREPGNPQLAAARIAVALKIGGLQGALAEAAALQKAAPQLPTAPVLEGDVYMAAHKYDDASQAYAKAFQQKPSTLAAMRLFRAKLAAGHGDAAAAMLRDWFAKNPNDVATAEVLGSYELQKHNFADAEKRFEFVLSKSPRDIIALNNLAWIAQKAGDLKAARTYAERAYLMSSNLPQTADTLGWILVREGEAADAVGLLQQANFADKSDSTIQYHLAVALNDTGHRERAITLLQPLLKAPVRFDDKPAAEKLFAQLSKK